jgi:hypothetical protein
LDLGSKCSFRVNIVVSIYDLKAVWSWSLFNIIGIVEIMYLTFFQEKHFNFLVFAVE